MSEKKVTLESLLEIGKATGSLTTKGSKPYINPLRNVLRLNSLSSLTERCIASDGEALTDIDTLREYMHSIPIRPLIPNSPPDGALISSAQPSMIPGPA